jgi:hypothetical protein
MRLPKDALEQVEREAKTHGITRSMALRRIVELGLTAKAKRT